MEERTEEGFFDELEVYKEDHERGGGEGVL